MGKLLFSTNCEGVHLAAVCPAGGKCPAPVTLIGDTCDAQASTWVEALPSGAVVLLAAIDSQGKHTKTALGALARAGLGCPLEIPFEAGCVVAAAVGRKGSGKWTT